MWWEDIWGWLGSIGRLISYGIRRRLHWRIHIDREHQSINAISKQTEDIATYNVDKEAEFQEEDYTGNNMQREVIQRSYFDNEGEFDYINCGEMGISESTFCRIKTEVIGIQR